MPLGYVSMGIGTVHAANIQICQAFGYKKAELPVLSYCDMGGRKRFVGGQTARLTIDKIIGGKCNPDSLLLTSSEINHFPRGIEAYKTMLWAEVMMLVLQ
jgi:hypothetical protein